MDKRAKIEFGKKIFEKSDSYASVSIWNRSPKGATEMDSIRQKVKASGGLVQMGKKLVLSKYLEKKFSIITPLNMKGDKLLVLFNGSFEVLGSLKKALQMDFIAATVDGIDVNKEAFDFVSKFSSKEQILSSLVGCIKSPIAMLATCIKIHYEQMEGKI